MRINVLDFYNEKLANEFDSIKENHHKEINKLFSKYKLTEGSILDLGCGTGLLKEYLEGNFKFVGIDISPHMLCIAKKRNYKIIQGKIEETIIKIENNSFDFVISMSALLFIKDIKYIIEEMKRIAKRYCFVSLDNVNDEFIKKFACSVYNHISLKINNSLEDYQFYDWKSPSTGISVNSRIVMFK